MTLRRRVKRIGGSLGIEQVEFGAAAAELVGWIAGEIAGRRVRPGRSLRH